MQVLRALAATAIQQRHLIAAFEWLCGTKYPAKVGIQLVCLYAHITLLHTYVLSEMSAPLNFVLDNRCHDVQFAMQRTSELF